MDGVVALVRKIKYFKGPCASRTRFHISIGHHTVMATATFCGATELAGLLPPPAGGPSGANVSVALRRRCSCSLNTLCYRRLPKLWTHLQNIYDFLTTVCARRTGTAAHVERRRRSAEGSARQAGELAEVARARQARPLSACTAHLALSPKRRLPVIAMTTSSSHFPSLK